MIRFNSQLRGLSNCLSAAWVFANIRFLIHCRPSHQVPDAYSYRHRTPCQFCNTAVHVKSANNSAACGTVRLSPGHALSAIKRDPMYQGTIYTNPINIVTILVHQANMTAYKLYFGYEGEVHCIQRQRGGEEICAANLTSSASICSKLILEGD